jgi:HSP20 family molecular chaperone IbpA
MNRTVYFNSPFLLGFEHLERLLERTAKSGGDGYPPYNIEQSGEDGLCITLAVAGFGREELNVTVEDRQLVIRGKQSENGDKNFLHRGIAARQFQRAFVLAEGIEVSGASLENGLLSICLKRPKSNTIVRTIEIEAGRPVAKRSVP